MIINRISRSPPTQMGHISGGFKRPHAEVTDAMRTTFYKKASRDSPGSHPLIRQRAPLRGHALGAALRQGEQREGRVRRAFGREDARPRDPQVRDFVALAEAVDDGI